MTAEKGYRALILAVPGVPESWLRYAVDGDRLTLTGKLTLEPTFAVDLKGAALPRVRPGK